MHYSPENKDANLSVTDSRGWRLAIISDGAAIKDLSQEEFKMVSTAQLKLQLTNKMDRLAAKGGMKDSSNAKKR